MVCFLCVSTEVLDFSILVVIILHDNYCFHVCLSLTQAQELHNDTEIGLSLFLGLNSEHSDFIAWELTFIVYIFIMIVYLPIFTQLLPNHRRLPWTPYMKKATHYTLTPLFHFIIFIAHITTWHSKWLLIYVPSLPAPL